MLKFLDVQCLAWNPISSYTKVISAIPMLANEIDLGYNRAEYPMQIDIRANLRYHADWRLILPEGIGRSGLLILSSSIPSIWFEISNCRRWSQTQNNDWRRSDVVWAGAENAANAAYNEIWDRAQVDKGTYEWDDRSLDIRLCKVE